jgi:predicted DNA-binding transcriptional regulator AlpA
MNRFGTLEDLVAWLRDAPTGTQLDASTFAEALEDLAAQEPKDEPESRLEAPVEWGWPERLWIIPAERRLGVKEACQALEKSRTWLYAHMSEGQGRDRIPHRKLDGQVLFTAGELRAWIRDQEETVHGGRMESSEPERRGQLRVS